jgi:serine/threonine-protein kinase
LSFTTFPWTRVSEGGRTLGTTPLYKVPLPPGTHVLSLDNPDDNIHTTYTVTIKSGEAASRSLELK